MEPKNSNVNDEDWLVLIHESISSGRFDEIRKDCAKNIYSVPTSWKEKLKLKCFHRILKEGIEKFLNNNTSEQMGESSSNECNDVVFDEMVNKLLFQILKPVYTDILKSQMEECIDQSIDEYFESHRQAPTIEHIDPIQENDILACDRTQKEDGKELNSDKKENALSLGEEHKSLIDNQNDTQGSSEQNRNVNKNINKRPCEEENKSTNLCKKVKVLKVNQTHTRSSKQTKKKNSSSEKSILSSNIHTISRKDIGSSFTIDKSKEKSSSSKNNSIRRNKQIGTKKMHQVSQSAKTQLPTNSFQSSKMLNLVKDKQDKEKYIKSNELKSPQTRNSEKSIWEKNTTILNDLFTMDCRVNIEQLSLEEKICKQRNEINKKKNLAVNDNLIAESQIKKYNLIPLTVRLEYNRELEDHVRQLECQSSSEEL